MYDLRPDTAKITVPRDGSHVFTGALVVSSAAPLGTGTVSALVHVKSPVGSFSSWVTYTDSISVEEPPSLETLVVFASGNPNSGNVPLEVNLQAAVFGGLPPYVYSWNFGDGGTSSAATRSRLLGRILCKSP